MAIRAIEAPAVIRIYSDIATMLIEREPGFACEIGQIMKAWNKVIHSAKREKSLR